VELAAVVVVPDNESVVMLPEAPDPVRDGTSRSQCFSLLPILGNDVLQTWSKRVQKLGVQSLWLTSAAHDEKQVYSALSEFSQQGFERLLMIKLNSYAEMDLADLLQFHRQTRNLVTEAHDSRGHLGICVLDRAALHESEKKKASVPFPIVGRRRLYPFHGYAKRIFSPRERQELVGDALTGACAMRPLGEEIRRQVWIGKDVSIASSARIIGPTYIGDRTVIREGATVGPFASVECDCLIDYGCTVERSTLLPCTYLAPGLLIRDALVDGGLLEHLRNGAVADLESGGLARRLRPSECRTGASDQTADDVVSPWKGSALSSEKWHEVQL
jgi:carbonic anhydrase/acetyltransferase-like protein (isoleucine patch superfamily)